MSCILWLNMDFQCKIQNHFQILCPFFDILNPKEYPQSYLACRLFPSSEPPDKTSYDCTEVPGSHSSISLKLYTNVAEWLRRALDITWIYLNLKPCGSLPISGFYSLKICTILDDDHHQVKKKTKIEMILTREKEFVRKTLKTQQETGTSARLDRWEHPQRDQITKTASLEGHHEHLAVLSLESLFHPLKTWTVWSP